MLTLGLLIAFFTSVTICVTTSEKSQNQNDEPFCVEKVWEKTASSCEHKPDWIKPIQKYYDDVIESFSSFPEQLTEPADVVKTTFKTILTKVIESTNSKSKIISHGSTGILKSFAQINVKTNSAQGIIDEFTRMLPILMNADRQVVKNLKEIIGRELVCTVNIAISDLEREFKRYVIEFEKGDGKKEVDYEPVMKRVQKLTDTISLKGDVKLSKCQLKDPDVHDALIVLSFVLDYIMVLVHGLSSCSEAVILEQKCEEPPVVLHVVVVTVAAFFSDITESIVVNTIPGAVNVMAHLTTLGNCSSKLNETLRHVFQSVRQLQQLSNGTQGISSG